MVTEQVNGGARYWSHPMRCSWHSGRFWWIRGSSRYHSGGDAILGRRNSRSQAWVKSRVQMADSAKWLEQKGHVAEQSPGNRWKSFGSHRKLEVDLLPKEEKQVWLFRKISGVRLGGLEVGGLELIRGLFQSLGSRNQKKKRCFKPSKKVLCSQHQKVRV